MSGLSSGQRLLFSALVAVAALAAGGSEAQECTGLAPDSCAGSLSRQTPCLDFDGCVGGLDLCTSPGDIATACELELNLRGREMVDLECVASDVMCLRNLGGVELCCAKTCIIEGDFLDDLEYLITAYDREGDTVCGTGRISCTGHWGGCFSLQLTHAPGAGGGDPTAGHDRDPECTSGSGDYLPGTQVELTAHPAEGWRVLRWEGTDDDSSAGNSNQVTVTDDIEVRVIYTEAGPECYPLKRLFAGRGGGEPPTATPTQSAECEGADQYVAGEEISLLADPAEGFRVAGWRGTIDNRSTDLENTAIMPAKAHEVLVVYERFVTHFDSSFEEEGFCDWSRRKCRGCNRAACRLQAQSSLFPLGTYRAGPGAHSARLSGPDEADFDLLLQWWNGAEWLTVASGMTPLASEVVQFEGPAGEYRWEVRSAAGAGDFELMVDHPGLAAADNHNRLERFDGSAQDGDFVLRSIYENGARGKDHLVDKLPGIDGGEDSYEVSFWIRPEAGLVIQGKKLMVLQAIRQVGGKQKVFELFLRTSGDAYALIARGWESGRRKTALDGVQLEGGAWRRIRVVWRAASGAGLDDGLLAIYTDDSLQPSDSVELENSSLRIDQVLFGQVKGKRGGTDGVVLFDQFESDWSQ